jgi:hypothetical protein
VRRADKPAHRDRGEIIVLLMPDRFGEAEINHLDEKIVFFPNEH